MKLLYSSCLFLLLAYSCQQKDDDHIPSLRKPIQIIGEVLTRSAMESGFTAYDEIGVFMLNRTSTNTPSVLIRSSGNWLDNGYFQMDNNGKTWIPLAPIYWKDVNSVMDVVAYYPYIDIGGLEYNVTSIPFNVQTDQQEISSLRRSDFLYAEAKAMTPQNATNGIALGFKHLLCKLTVHLKLKPDELESASKITLTAHNVNYTGTINLSNGIINTNTELISDISLYIKSDQEAEGILFPQQIATGRFLSVSLSLNGSSSVSYVYSLSTPLTLEEGKEYIVDFDCITAN